jgi:hypothetical protein
MLPSGTDFRRPFFSELGLLRFDGLEQEATEAAEDEKIPFIRSIPRGSGPAAFFSGREICGENPGSAGTVRSRRVFRPVRGGRPWLHRTPTRIEAASQNRDAFSRVPEFHIFPGSIPSRHE